MVNDSQEKVRQRGPFPAYEGNEPYLFVSFAHRDRDVVFAEIARLHEQGVRLWYDEGIQTGDDWRETVATRLRDSTAVLLFLTRAFFASPECGLELRLAHDFRIPLLVIAPERLLDDDKRAKPHLYMILLPLQWVMKYELALEDYWAALAKAIPPKVIGQAHSLPRNVETRIVVRRCLSIRPPATKGWTAVEDGARVPVGSEMRLLVQPEQNSYGALVVKALDRRGAVTDISVFGLQGAVERQLEKAIWNVMPPPGGVFREDFPAQVTAWRIGLMVSAIEDSPLLNRLRSLENEPCPVLPGDVETIRGQRRSLLLPPVTCLSFGLPEGTSATAVEAAGTVVDWSTIYFGASAASKHAA